MQDDWYSMLDVRHTRIEHDYTHCPFHKCKMPPGLASICPMCEEEFERIRAAKKKRDAQERLRAIQPEYPMF